MFDFLCSFLKWGLFLGVILLLWKYPAVLFPLITIFVIFYLYKNKKTNEVPNETAKMEQKLSDMMKNNPHLQIGDNIVLQTFQNDSGAIHLFYKNKELCLLEDYKKKQPLQYQNLLKRICETDQEKKSMTTKLSFQDTLHRLKDYSHHISDEKILSHLHLCIQRLEKLQALLTEYPQKEAKAAKLNQYYLPMLMDILEQYIMLSKAENKNIQAANLVKTLNLLNEAVEKIISTLFEEDHLDMNVNMEVLEDLLIKDGLIDDQLRISIKELYEKVK